MAAVVSMEVAAVIVERYRYVLDRKFFWAVSVGGDSTTVHRPRLGLSPVFEPNVGEGTASGVENAEVLKTVRNESGDLDQFVVMRGRIVLQLADGYLLRFFAPSNLNMAERERQYGNEIKQRSN